MPRPSRPLLDRDAILKTALEIIDTDGLDALSMRRLGDVLGVDASSIYHHVDNKSDLLEGVLKLVAEQSATDVQASNSDWIGAATALARAYFTALSRHPNLVVAAATHPVRDSGTVAAYDEIARRLVSASWPIGLVMSAINVIECYVLGMALGNQSGDEWLEIAQPGSHPTLAEALDADDMTEIEEFELGLRALLCGLEEIRGEATGEAT